MKKGTILWGIIIVCGICIVGLLWKSWLQSRTIDAYGQVLSVERNFIEIEDQLRDIRYREILTLQSAGCEIPEIDIRHKDSPTQVYLRLHQGVCAACYVNSIIDIYAALSDSFPIYVVGSYEYKSTFDGLLRDCRLSNVGSINDMLIQGRIPADSADAPYIFTISDRGTITNILFLEKSAMNLEKVEAYKRVVTLAN